MSESVWKEVASVAKAKILTVKENGSFDGKNGPVKIYEMVIQEVDGQGRVWTAQKYGDLPEGVSLTAPSDVENIVIKEKTYNDTVTTAVFFNDGNKGGGKWGGKGGGYQKEDIHLKVVSFAYAYAKDVLLGSPQEGGWNWEAYYQFADQTSAAMLKSYNDIKRVHGAG